MTSLYRLDAPARAIAAAFGAEAGDDPWTGDYVAPGRPAPVIVSDGRVRSRRFLRPKLWGVPPPPQGTRPLTTVRNLESPFWIGTLRHPELRCLVPATAFVFWSGPDGARRQHWFSLPSRPIFAFAGIQRQIEDWPGFAMLTTEPNRLVAHYQPKLMPVIVHAEDYDRWLTADWREAAALVTAYPSQLMAVGDTPP
ncbi:putative SOS response-associated peptidase YedK [Sphingopyxis panaciterrae]|uniref:SOS response-associated peptidase family protein n=1 Tax=Sphingopyxis panaciterrae TaxID=363841 RepID=UPI0014242A3C|nr:SOS response-associated peptidase family protein [Sphingopyxis panaciterrae]NIJ38076.1 putative SOS response-associated peptidase YedK [Sphingopyxis panaciterrae]